MNRNIGLTLLSFSFVLSAATPYVGIAVSDGPFRLNGASAAGNATLFSGALVETSSHGSQLRLQDGSVLFLGPQTRGKIFADRTLIERGSARLETSRAYRLEALSLRIAGGPLHSSGIVAVRGTKVEVAALDGKMLVSNAGGVLVASVLPSHDRTFMVSGSRTSTVSGVLSASAGAYRLTDEVSNANVELRGTVLASEVGRRVRVSGTAVAGALAAGSTSEVIQVATLNRLAVPFSARAFDPPAQAGGASGLNIVIVEGDGAINNVRERAAREAIVRVEDENHKPVSGASVSFLLPDSGPSGTFADGSRLFSAVSDEQGQAVARFQPNSQTGKFRIKVDVSSQGRVQSAFIGETNSLLAAAGAAGGILGGVGTTAVVVGGVVVAAGAIATAAVLLNNGSSSPGQAISPGRQ